VINKAEYELLAAEIDKWNKELHSQSKLRFYRTFKECFVIENYVKMCSLKSNRSFISQLRAGVLPLKVEVGRFAQLPLEKRLCDHCKTLIEDEHHFIFVCPVYNNLRHDFLIHVSQYHDIQLMSYSDKLKLFMGDKKLVNKFASYIRNCFYKRNATLYSVS
jgi:hypothetical protein